MYGAVDHWTEVKTGGAGKAESIGHDGDIYYKVASPSCGYEVRLGLDWRCRWIKRNNLFTLPEIGNMRST